MLRKSRSMLLAGVAGLMLLAAMAVQAQTPAGQAGGTPMKDASPAHNASQAHNASPLSKADQKILHDMAMTSLAELDAARIAQAKSPGDTVKTYAQQMVDAHTKTLEDVQQVAQTKGVALPTELDKEHKANADKLSALSGAQFERSYLAQAGVLDHRAAERMLRLAARRAHDADVKALVMRTLPGVTQHLQTAQELNSGKSAAMGSSGSGATGASQDERKDRR